MSDMAKNKVICSVEVAKTILKRVDEVWQVDYSRFIKSKYNSKKLSVEEIEEVKREFYKESSLKSWQCRWNAKTNKIIIDETQDLAVLDFDTQYVPPKLIMYKLLIESSKKRLVWNYEFDGKTKTINNNKGKPNKIRRTEDLKEYDDLLNEYEKQVDKEVEMEQG